MGSLVLPAWCFAGQYPERCRSLVMVNGYPPPAYPSGVRWLAAKTPVRAMARGNVAQFYGRDVLDLAFEALASQSPPEQNRSSVSCPMVSQTRG